MTLLPILERELRLRARSRANHWGRFALGTVGLLIGLPPLLWSFPFTAPAALGRGAFGSLVSAAFLLCCAACLLTSDAISGERREGTLGLLLLTRVSGFEVLLGKLASSALASVLGLVAFLPVLMLPILAGGVTAGEAAHQGLVLFDTLFLALSAGLWASARGCERFRTAWAAVLVVAGLVLVPLVLGFIFSRSHLHLELASPLGAVFQASDSAYRASSARYWLSLGVVQLAAWMLLLGALLRLRARPGNKSEAPSTGPVAAGLGQAAAPVADETSSAQPDVMSAATEQCPYCGRQNSISAIHCEECGTELHPRPRPARRSFTSSDAPTPLHWLLLRRRGLGAMLWLAAGLSSLYFGFFTFLLRFFAPRAWVFPVTISVIYQTSGLVTLAVTSSIFAWVASRFFVEARSTGELELLLTTPMGAEAIVAAQWSTLKRLVAGPVLLMLVPPCWQALVEMTAKYPYQSPPLSHNYLAASAVFHAANILLRAVALCWVGLWLGLRARTQARAILWTVLLVGGLPWALYSACSFLFAGLAMGTPNSWVSPWLLSLLGSHLADILWSLWLIRTARRQLRREIGGAEPLSLGQIR